MTPHIEAKIEEVSNIVLMPGDPLRAKYIADNFLDNVTIINKVRNMFGYTGFYKGKKVTVFASGMGMPSIGIYAYELFKFYNVDYIIRIGSCGVYKDSVNIGDVILVDKSYTESTFSYNMTSKYEKVCSSSNKINELIENTASELEINYMKCNMVTSDCFDYYIDYDSFVKRLPSELNLVGAEMEAFALFYTAKVLNKQASALLTVVDSHVKKEEMSSFDREKSLNNMILIALESALKL